ncbi:hypothetical protein D9M71_803340 [compost metagenome]
MKDRLLQPIISVASSKVTKDFLHFIASFKSLAVKNLRGPLRPEIAIVELIIPSLNNCGTSFPGRRNNTAADPMSIKLALV